MGKFASSFNCSGNATAALISFCCNKVAGLLGQMFVHPLANLILIFHFVVKEYLSKGRVLSFLN
jgi:hypothetical protein